VVPTAFDWHLLMGDDTALPAIARRLGELPTGARAVVLVEVDSPEDRIDLPSGAKLDVQWIYCNAAGSGATPLLDALRAMPVSDGTFHSWIACETAQAKLLRTYLIAECKANPKWIRASGYWRRGNPRFAGQGLGDGVRATGMVDRYAVAPLRLGSIPSIARPVCAGVPSFGINLHH
jgi:NADPH-dependent ferric siderophore reductase